MSMFTDDVDVTDEDLAEESALQQSFVVSQKSKKDEKLTETPVENAKDVPLFADFHGKGLKSISYLRLTKQDKPGAGFKGNISLSSDLETIYRMYGNGLYNIEACNHKHQVLRIRENVLINIDMPENPKKEDRNIDLSVDSAKDKHISKLIEGINDSHNSEVNRIQSLTDSVTKQVTSQGEQFVKLVQTQTESAAQREREHMAGVNKGQQDFFASMMLATNQMFQQTMAMLLAGHNSQIEVMRASFAREQNNPMQMVEILMKGLQLGKDLEGDDSPDWIKGMTAGGDMLGSLAKIAGALPGGFVPKAIAPNVAVQNPAAQVPQTTPKSETKQSKGSKPQAPKIFTDEEVVAFLKLKKVLRARGIDPAAVAQEASKHYESVPDSELFGESEVDEKTDENAESPAEVEGGEHNDSGAATE